MIEEKREVFKVEKDEQWRWVIWGGYVSKGRKELLIEREEWKTYYDWYSKRNEEKLTSITN